MLKLFRAYKLLTSDEVPHPVSSEYWVQGSPLPRVRGAQPRIQFHCMREKQGSCGVTV